ncbi:MAG: GatB/YqeY domain-containing protein [Deltaproteobacteria bacterium]|nr:MAG: GatB/YqeY domain-containing protein [Deltaproteobacteria bacterium]
MLIERIEGELKDAARARDKHRLGTLRMLKSALKYREIEINKELSDAEVVQVAQTLIKQRRDSAGQFRSGGRPELAQNEEAEIVVLESFLPRQLGDDELAQLASEAVTETGATDPKGMGAVMKALMPKIAGRAEGKRVSDAVKAALAAKAGQKG